jgi:transposase
MSKVAAFLQNEVTVDRASTSNALEAHPKETAMNHAAIDLGGKESQICIRQPDGTIIEERKVPTRKLTELVMTWAPSRVVMETSAEAFKIADAALAAGHQVRVVPETLVRLLGVGEHGVKNDRRDAQQLSRASWQTDVPSVHIPSKLAREPKSICGARDVLVGTRTKLINNVRGWMRTRLWKLRGGTTGTFADRVRGHAAAVGEPFPEHTECQLRMLSVVVEETKAADKQLHSLAREHEVTRSESVGKSMSRT